MFFYMFFNLIWLSVCTGEAGEDEAAAESDGGGQEECAGGAG